MSVIQAMLKGSLKNELFINNGDLTFSEKAKEYNLDNEGYFTHATFFNYDQDGDLDCYILNNSFRDPAKTELYIQVRQKPSPGGHKLMRNDGNTFSDVTQQAGIYSSDISFGLGVAVSDLNGDHLPDLYISNDFDDEILLIRMLSTEGPRLIKGDVNNDKLEDFILPGAACDPEKLFVQKSDGSFYFKLNAAFNKNAGTFESTCGSMLDFDKDGDLDLIICRAV